jgi:hypothetical protein
MFSIPLRENVTILIDAENVEELSCIEQVLKISDYYGQLSICRAYGDWSESKLSPWCEKIDSLKVERIQVKNIGKNATDHRILVEAGEILGGNFGIDRVDVFIIVSGDGDFASACNLLQERVKHVIGMANKSKTSNDLKEVCSRFYFLEDLDHELSKLEQRYPISPREVRQFYGYLFFAHVKLTREFDWLTYTQLDAKLRELLPDYENKFGKYSLSEWLRNFPLDFECSGSEQMIRRIDPNLARLLRLILDAYYQTQQSDGRAHKAELGKKLRELDFDYENDFGGKTLSKWLGTFPHIFKSDGHLVWLNSVDDLA